MRQYGEVRMVRTQDDSMALEIARDLVGLLLCIGTMVVLVFLAGGV